MYWITFNKLKSIWRVKLLKSITFSKFYKKTCCTWHCETIRKILDNSPLHQATKALPVENSQLDIVLMCVWHMEILSSNCRPTLDKTYFANARTEVFLHQPVSLPPKVAEKAETLSIRVSGVMNAVMNFSWTVIRHKFIIHRRKMN
jgi:hypothetical protein